MIIGKIVNTIGLKGELKVVVSQNKLDKFRSLQTFFIDGFSNELTCEKSKVFGNKMSLKIVGYDDINLVLQFKNKDFYILATQNQLAKNEFFVSDLVGLEIFNAQNSFLGKIVDVENYGAGDILVFLDADNKEKRVPFNFTYFAEINPSEKRIVASANFDEGVVWKLTF